MVSADRQVEQRVMRLASKKTCTILENNCHTLHIYSDIRPQSQKRLFREDCGLESSENLHGYQSQVGSVF